jgi:hypothetical protein
MSCIDKYDAFRKTLKGGRVLYSPSVFELPCELRARAIWRTAEYTSFHPESKHDWGIFTLGGYRFIWIIREEPDLTMTIYLKDDFLGVEFALPKV